MARRAEPNEIYAVADRFVEEALRRDGSLFTPGTSIWSAENIEDLYERFVGNPDVSSDSFEDKFRRQLQDAPPETQQLAAELLYVYLLFPSNIGGDKKRRIVHSVLEGTSIALPDDLEQSLDHGIANFGPALQNPPVATHDAPGVFPGVEDDAAEGRSPLRPVEVQGDSVLRAAREGWRAARSPPASRLSRTPSSGSSLRIRSGDSKAFLLSDRRGYTRT